MGCNCCNTNVQLYCHAPHLVHSHINPYDSTLCMHHIWLFLLSGILHKQYMEYVNIDETLVIFLPILLVGKSLKLPSDRHKRKWLLIFIWSKMYLLGSSPLARIEKFCWLPITVWVEDLNGIIEDRIDVKERPNRRLGAMEVTMKEWRLDMTRRRGLRMLWVIILDRHWDCCE